MPSEFMNNENRKRLADTINRPMDRSADGSIAGGARIDVNSVPGNEMPPGILNSNSTPMMKDAHAAGRHSYDNVTVKPAEKSRAAESAETRRRLANPGKPTDTYR
jgi:hypothetical protein